MRRNQRRSDGRQSAMPKLVELGDCLVKGVMFSLDGVGGSEAADRSAVIQHVPRYVPTFVNDGNGPAFSRPVATDTGKVGSLCIMPVS